MRLPEAIPEGQLVNRQWLTERGYSRPEVDYYLRTGALVSLARGIYRRPGPPLKWGGIGCSLQELGVELHVGGARALKEAGHGPFVAMTAREDIHLYSPDKLPAWLEEEWAQAESSYRFVLHRQPWLKNMSASCLALRAYGVRDWPLPY